MHPKEYERLSDKALLQRAREREEQAVEALVRRYKPLVRSRARSLYVLGADSEDLLQEGMIGLFKAIRDFDEGRERSFSAFAALCVERQLYTAVEASLRQKNRPLNTAVSLNTVMRTGGEEETGRELRHLLAAGQGDDPETVVLGAEAVRLLKHRIETRLSPFERRVWERYLQGMDYLRIAEALGCSAKSADNALQRIRRKSRQAIAEEETIF